MRKIIWTPEPEPVIPEPVVVAVLDPPVVRVTESPPGKTPSKNGHKSLKIRDLFEPEKDKIKNELFIPNNGIIERDLCVTFKRQHMPEEVTIFQVTGYVTTLHGQVAKGVFRLRNQRAYEAAIEKHRALWNTYNTPKYIERRNRAQTHPPQPRMLPQPQFETLTSRRVA
jgi:hypothetical protein